MEQEKQKHIEDFDSNSDFVDLGLHIAYYRRRAGVTQQELADQLGVGWSYLSRIESPNQYQHFSFELFFSICRILYIEPKYFFIPLPGPGSM